MQAYFDALGEQALQDISCLTSLWMLLTWWFFIPFLILKWAVLTIPVWVPLAIIFNVARPRK